MATLKYVLGYGGGLVGGDAIEIECSVGADTTGALSIIAIAVSHLLLL